MRRKVKTDSCWKKFTFLTDDNGYYHFLFPSLWYTSVCNNKAIGLRRIETRAKAKNIQFTFKYERVLTSGPVVRGSSRFNLHFLPTDDIETIMSTMCYYINNFIKSDLKSKSHPEYAFTLQYWYDSATNKAQFYDVLSDISEDGLSLDWTDATVDFTFHWVNKDFLSTFNDKPETDWASYKHKQISSDFFEEEDDETIYNVTYYEFENVWNRKFCFIHASFVTGTSFQYLGRSGDFYPKPSKMYQFTGNSTDFTLAVSYDGRVPVKTDEIDFIVELAYIYTTGEYMAE